MVVLQNREPRQTINRGGSLQLFIQLVLNGDGTWPHACICKNALPIQWSISTVQQ